MSVAATTMGAGFPLRPFLGGTVGVGEGSVGEGVSSVAFTGEEILGLGFGLGVAGGGVGAGTGGLLNREPKIFSKTLGLLAEAGGGMEGVAGFGKGFAGEGALAGVDLVGVAVSAKASEAKVLRDKRTGRIFFISQRIRTTSGDCPLWENLSRARMKMDRNLDREGHFTIRWTGTFYPALFILNSTSLQAFPYRTRVEIDLDALRANLRAIREHLGRGVSVMAVVKANAYGHGVRPIVRALRGRVEFLGVANLREAVEVREEDQETPIFLLGPALAEERREIIERGFLPAVCSLEEAKAYAALAGGTPFAIHLKIDTGMGRVGFLEGEVGELMDAMRLFPSLWVTGVVTHLPVADEDSVATTEQLARFRRIVERLAEVSPAPLLVHAMNSAGMIGFPVEVGELVRVGLSLYGSAPIASFQHQLRGILTWKARMTQIRRVPVGHGVSYGGTFRTERPSDLATLAVGYADGYPRHLSGRGAEVLIRGQRCPVLGRVTMDQIVVDVSGLPEVGLEDEVVLLGRQGAEEILVAELAEKAGTIAWEIFTGIGSRVERVYLFEK